MDPLSAILSSLRLQSGLVGRALLTAPWSVQSLGTQTAMFHAVVRGSCWVELQASPPVLLSPGDLVLLPHGSPHVMSSAPGQTPRPISSIPKVRDGTCVPRLIFGGGGEDTELLCGWFVLRHSSASSAFLKLWPEVVHLSAEEAPLARWLDANIKLLGSELDTSIPGSDAIIARTVDLLFARVLRTYAARGNAPGWLGALRDPSIAQAVALIHSEPEKPWTAGELAKQVGLSRTAFHQRFRQTMGATPGSYLTTWRMREACELLDTHPEWSVAQVAERVSYQSEDAFCKSFRRQVGLSPSVWRRRQAAG